MTSRRAFLLGLGTALAAPAIVRADSLMRLWVPPVPNLLTRTELMDAFNTAAMKIRMKETWTFGYDMWRRVYFDEDRQEVISEAIDILEKPFVVVPSGKLFLPENSPPGTIIQVWPS